MGAGSSLWPFLLKLLPSSSTPTPPASCQSSSAGSRVTPGCELTGAAVFPPCEDASSPSLNPVKQESIEGLQQGPQEAVWAETRQPVAPRAPPRLERRTLGTGTGTGQRWAAPEDGNYDFRKLECCLGNITAHSSMGGTLGAGGRNVCTYKHTCECACIHMCTHAHTQGHSGTYLSTHTHTPMLTNMHTDIHVRTCTCTHSHCVHIDVHAHRCTRAPPQIRVCADIHTFLPRL